jgi:nucleoside-diphosphate-sugar epimerase
LRILITGGSGFIGTRLISLLYNIENIEIVNFDKVISIAYPEITTIGDVRVYSELNSVCQNVDVIFNLAAEHADDVTPLNLYKDVNVGGARNVVKAAIHNGIKHIIFTSSVAVYSLNSDNPDESFDTRPFNEYGRTKLEAEKIFYDWYSSNMGLTLSIIRPAVVFGEGNRGNVYNLINQIVKRRFIMIGDGKNCKSMGYVGNVADFLKFQLEKKPGYYLYNYADKNDLSCSDIVNIVHKEIGISSINLKLPYFVGFFGGLFFDIVSKITGKKFSISSIRIKKFCANTTVNSTMASSSGFNPRYTLEEGMKRMIKHEFK